MPGSYWINNATAPDNAPTYASTLDNLPLIDHIVLNINNAAIYWSIKLSDNYLGHDKFGAWQPYILAIPQTIILYRSNAVGFKFYAAVPGLAKPAQVTVEAVTV